MGYRKIVIGTDGSDSAAIAQASAARLAKRLRAQLVIVTAFDPPAITEERAVSVLASAKEAALGDRVEAATWIQRGEPADIILQVAQREGADLIVVGNKGMGKATRFRLGSVPDRAAHYADCDLLIVDTTGALAAGESAPKAYRRIVIGTDGSPTASEAARKGLELAMRLGSSVTLVYVGDPLLGAITLEQTAALAPEGVEADQRVVQGDPAEELCRIAVDSEGDLVVVGNKGMSGARRFLLGSVPNRVAHLASTDVLVAKTVDRTLDEIAPGHGAIIDVAGRRLAVYRDDDGQLVAVSPRCTHMGCTVDWNDSERTWDCPCHGSRYDVRGQVVRGPAAKPLDPEELKA
jgi:nucleotide-binding universal stress UspA family protein/nitrite reductase/ring-hydroxylating ferredoxin subunit